MWRNRFVPKRSAEERRGEISEAALGCVVSLVACLAGALVLYFFGESLFAGENWMQALGMVALGCAVIGAYAFVVSLLSFGIAATIGPYWMIAILGIGFVIAKAFGMLD